MLSMATGALRSVLALAGALMLVVGCESTADRQSAQRACTEKQATAEIDRVCALPAEQRAAELKRIQEQSGAFGECLARSARRYPAWCNRTPP